MSGNNGNGSPVAQPEMDFPAAMQAVIEGRKVTRVEWRNEDCVFLSAGFLSLRKTDGRLHTLLVSDGDMQATDWVVVREN